MLLKLDDSPVPMKLVYLLSDELKNDPNRVKMAQELTLDPARPLMGLKGSHGLFASDEWWENVYAEKIPLSFIKGVIESAYIAGQDEEGINNTVDVKLEDGSTVAVGIYTNDVADVSLFKPGCLVYVVYAFDELKRQPARDGGVNYSKVAVEMAVSESPI